MEWGNDIQCLCPKWLENLCDFVTHSPTIFRCLCIQETYMIAVSAINCSIFIDIIDIDY